MNSHTSPVTWKARGFFFGLLSFYFTKIPNHPFKIRLVRCILTSLGPKRFVATHEQSDTCFIADPMECIGWEILTKGNFEACSLALCSEIIRKHGGWFADIGANRGLFSCLVAKITGAQVLSFEPNPESFIYLVDNIAANNLKNVTLVHSALSNQNSFLPWRHGMATRTAWSRQTEPNERPDYFVSSIRFSDVVSHFNLRGPTLLKMDIEGAEVAALNGIGFDKNRPKYVLIEADPKWDEKKNYLEQNGYKCINPEYIDQVLYCDDCFVEGNALFIDSQLKNG